MFRSLIHFEFIFVYGCHLFLIFSASVRSLPFLSFIVPIFAWNIPLVSNFLKEISSHSHSIVFFYFFALITEEVISFLSLLAILWNSAFKWVYLSFPPLPFTSIFIAVCKASSDNHFAFFHFSFLGIVLIPTSCTKSRTSVHSSSGTLSIRYNPLNLFVTSTV